MKNAAVGAGSAASTLFVTRVLAIPVRRALNDFSVVVRQGVAIATIPYPSVFDAFADDDAD